MILLDRVTKTYNKNAAALERISLHVEPKEFVIIVGASGAGKSTLLKLLTREEKPTSGKIIVGGIDYETLKDREIPLLRRKIGVVFQDFKLLPNKNVYENVAFALEIVGMGNREIHHTVPRVLDIVGLRGKEKRMLLELSGGERQRIGIARAIYKDPQILVLDEATSSLDSKTESLIQRSLEKELSKKTVISIAHRISTLKSVDRVIVFDEGRVVEEGSFKDLSKNKDSAFAKISNSNTQ